MKLYDHNAPSFLPFFLFPLVQWQLHKLRMRGKNWKNTFSVLKEDQLSDKITLLPLRIKIDEDMSVCLEIYPLLHPLWSFPVTNLSHKVSSSFALLFLVLKRSSSMKRISQSSLPRSLPLLTFKLNSSRLTIDNSKKPWLFPKKWKKKGRDRPWGRGGKRE